MIKTGRYGQVLYSPDGVAPPVAIVSINAWKASFKQEYEDVTCFQDVNKVYIPGMKDVSGSYSGFFNSDELTPFEAGEAETPGTLQLVPNTTEPTFGWEGLAYMDAEIDCSVDGAPKISGEFKAAGPWSGPAGFGALAARMAKAKGNAA